MRIVVLLLPAFMLAAACPPADAQNPYGYRMSSLMPLPQVADYAAPTAPAAGPMYYQTAPPAYQPAPPVRTPYSYASNAPSRPATYPASNTFDRWSSGSYRPAQGWQRNNYFSYASQPEAAPQPEPESAQSYPGAAPSYQSGGAPAPQTEAYPSAGTAPMGAYGGCDGAAGYGGAYGGAYGDAYGGGYGVGYGAGYGAAYGGGYAACSPVFAGPAYPRWHIGVYALFMDRVDDNPQWFSFDTNDESNQLMRTTNDWQMGAQLNVTRTFGCGRYGVQGVYWGLFRDPQEMNLYGHDMAGWLNSVYDFDPLVVDDPNAPGNTIAVNDFFDGAFRHQLRRSYEIHNVEINFLGGSLMGHGIGVADRGLYGGKQGCGGYGAAYGAYGAYDAYGCGAGGACGGYGAGCCDGGGCAAACGPRLNVGWLFGVRYFKFQDDLQFATDRTNGQFHYDDDEMFYDIDVDNNLIGVQLGFGSDWAVTDWLHLRAGTKFGLYGNAISHQSRIYGANGNAWVSAGPNANMEFNVDSNDAEVAFLGELDLGLTMYFTRRLTGSLGYRVVAVNNVAVATDQIPRHFAGIQDVEDIDSNSGLVLHGAYAGIGYSW